MFPALVSGDSVEEIRPTTFFLRNPVKNAILSVSTVAWFLPLTEFCVIFEICFVQTYLVGLSLAKPGGS